MTLRRRKVHSIGPFKILERVGPITFCLSDMGRKADVVHADRLKASSHSIRTEDRNNEEVTRRAPIDKRVNPSRKTRKNRPETEDLGENLHTFLNTGEENTEKAALPTPQPPPMPKRIAKHRKRRSSQKYLVYNENKEPTTGT